MEPICSNPFRITRLMLDTPGGASRHGGGLIDFEPLAQRSLSDCVAGVRFKFVEYHGFQGGTYGRVHSWSHGSELEQALQLSKGNMALMWVCRCLEGTFFRLVSRETTRKPTIFRDFPYSETHSMSMDPPMNPSVLSSLSTWP